jgi:hypothetical protein
MGLGHVVTLRARSVEQAAWKAYRPECDPTYDAREIARMLREQA